MPFFTEKAQKQLSAEVDNWTEAFTLLRLIDAEFKSDPRSVQCFDLRIVERVRRCVVKRDELERQNPWLSGTGKTFNGRAEGSGP